MAQLCRALGFMPTHSSFVSPTLRYGERKPGEPMLTNDKIVAAINEQIGNEFGASLQYVAIAAYFASDALPQLSQHFFKQADEEDTHAMRFINYIIDVGGKVVLPAIDAPKSEFQSAEEAIKLSLDQEITVTHQINALVELARSESDFITINFLQWFLTEQLEEVSSMDTLLKIVQRAENNLLRVEEYLARVGVHGRGTSQPS
jgi:ferritin